MSLRCHNCILLTLQSPVVSICIVCFNVLKSHILPTGVFIIIIIIIIIIILFKLQMGFYPVAVVLQ
jgi:hypothetical protein